MSVLLKIPSDQVLFWWVSCHLKQLNADFVLEHIEVLGQVTGKIKQGRCAVFGMDGVYIVVSVQAEQVLFIDWMINMKSRPVSTVKYFIKYVREVAHVADLTQVKCCPLSLSRERLFKRVGFVVDSTNPKYMVLEV